ncbi:nudix hydrolase 20, chloroplastic-like [Vicia villosa]|uniref:nudix hydrolase 20, chloroplastic-like n=1 Tax=Vicia villosa TaxID=3911 RepID=UPI00273A9999|nr:nudix hydrolase 20, chloroplastic-like [Vicia villosa]
MMGISCNFVTILCCYKPFTPSSSSTNFTFPSFSSSTITNGGTCKLTWDNIVRNSESKAALEEDSSSCLQTYFHKVQLCNRSSDKKSEFLPFVVEGNLVGFIHNRFVEHLRRYSDVFVFLKDENSSGDYVTLHSLLKTVEERTDAVGYVVKYLGEEHIPGIRNELYPVKSSYHTPAFFLLERAAAPYFGIKAYAIHVNGYVELNEQQHVWIGKRSLMKSTFPGMLDNLVAGGLPHGIDCRENVVKECKEEAGIPRSISIKARPVGAISYMDIDGYKYHRDVLFCYDLKLPENFVPYNEDGEVESFKLIHIKQVEEIVRKTQFFKPTCAIVIIDFLIRHGYITPESFGYLDLIRSLRIGDCS